MDDPFCDKNLPKSNLEVMALAEAIDLKHKSKGGIYTSANKRLRSNFEVAELDGLTDEGS